MSAGETIEARTLDLIPFAAALDDAGLTETARRVRIATDDLQTVIHELNAERSARIAFQNRCETQQEILGKYLYQALT